MEQADPHCLDLAAAETACAQAEQRLGEMKARYKGAPPSHSQAAQQIRAQERVLGTARMKLSQARLRQVAAASQPTLDRAAA
jgi:hypothetical protein